MNICIISINKNDYAPRRIFSEGKKRGHIMHLTTWRDISLKIQSGRILFYANKISFQEFDAVIPRSCKTVVGTGKNKRTLHRETLLRLLVEYTDKENIYLLNHKYFSGYQSLDKLSQQYFLAANGLPYIPSYYFFKKNAENISRFPTVAKIADGSLGKQVVKLKDHKDLADYLKERKKDGEFFLFQKFYKINHDYRILVVNRKALGILKRVAQKGEWRTNISLGGLALKGEKDRKMERLAVDAAKKMGLDYAGIDILKKSGNLHIIEINSLAQFKGFEKAFRRINVAEEIIKLIEEKARK